MTKRVLSPWCKDVKKMLIDLDMSVTELAEKTGISRPYTSGIINGRLIAPELASRIGDTIGVPYSDNVT